MAGTSFALPSYIPGPGGTRNPYSWFYQINVRQEFLNRKAREDRKKIVNLGALSVLSD
jgi:hypothetical protein